MATVLDSRRVRAGLTSILVLLALAFTDPSSAFVVNSYLNGSEALYLKWGDNHAGTLAGSVYWSFIPAGTAGDPYCGVACPGTSVDWIHMEVSPGGGFAPTLLTSLEPRIVAMMAQWSAYTGIQFVKVDPDSGVAINDPLAVPPATGQIRIGAFPFASGGGAVGFAPPPNGGTGAGDILFDANSFYQNYPLAEGSAYDPTFAPNDFQGLVLHELGHTIGLEHPPFDGTCQVMYVDTGCPLVIKRRLRADDIAGAGFLYGTIFHDGFE